MLIIEHEEVSMFWARSPIRFTNMSLWCPLVDPLLTAYHSNIGSHIVAMLKSGISNLRMVEVSYNRFSSMGLFIGS